MVNRHTTKPPCPGDPAAVERMREIGIDLRPLPERSEPMPRHVAFRLLAIPLAMLGAWLLSRWFA